MEKENIYNYTIKDLQNELGKARTTILNMINKLELEDTDKYYKKVKENGREKLYYNIKLLELLKKKEEKTSSKKAKIENTSISSSIIQPYIEQIEFLKKQIESKDKQIERLQQIIAVKEQKELEEKRIELLESKEMKQKRVGFFQRLFKSKENT